MITKKSSASETDNDELDETDEKEECKKKWKLGNSYRINNITYLIFAFNIFFPIITNSNL